MARKTPTVRNGTLVVEQPTGHDNTGIAVGSDAWFAWLAHGQTFAFDDSHARFTARTKRRGTRLFWYALRRTQGDLRELYLGRSAQLTLEHLRSISQQLDALGAQASVPVPSPHAALHAALHAPLHATLPPSRQWARDMTASPPMPSVPPPHALSLHSLRSWKAEAPQIQPPPVPTRAVALLSQARDRPLTVVCAPAGYGKTTALAQWGAASSLSVAWVGLDTGHNAPARFWISVSAAFGSVVPGLFKALQPQIRVRHPRLGDAVLAVLIAGLSRAPDPTMLVLDDYHMIRYDNAPIHQALAVLVKHLPPQVHIVLASREERPLALAQLRAHGQLLELHAADLQLTLDEAAMLLIQRFQLELSAEQVSALHTRTEGWVDGLCLAALALQKESEKPSDVARWIAAFGGEDRSVFDYLVEEVVQRLPAEMQSYLLQIGLLDQLTAPLCDAVTGTHHGSAMLAELERRQLFLVALDNQRRSYRFHHLFASALRQLVRQTQPEIVPQVFARASAWYEANGYPREAIDSAFAANDPSRAAQLIEASLPLAWETGDTASLREQLERLPEQVLRERPRLCVAHAYSLVMSGERAMVPRRLRQAEEAIASAAHTLSTTDLASLQAELGALRIDLGSTTSQDSPRAIITRCHQALAELPPLHPFRDFVSARLGVAHLLNGDPDAARELLSTLVRTRGPKGNSMHFCANLLYIGGAMHLQGRLEDALGLCHRAMQQAEVAGDGAAHVRAATDLVMGRVLYERNELEAAVEHLRSREYVRFAQAASLGEGVPALAYTYHAQGDTAAAHEVIERALAKWEQLEAENQQMWVWTGSLLRAHQAWLWLLQGDVGRASRWAHTLARRADDERAKDMFPPIYVSEWQHVVLARVYLQEGRAGEALSLLGALVAPAESSGRMARLLEILTLQAIAYDALGEGDAALRLLARALARAASERFIRTFVDGGPSVQRLLSQLAEAISTHRLTGLTGLTMEGPTAQRISAQRHQEASLQSYIQTLLAAFGPMEHGDAGEAFVPVGNIAVGANTIKPLTAALTERELEVMRWIAEGATNSVIAEHLVIALSTVKHHVHSILAKLEVANRTQALKRALDLRLLESAGGPSPVS